MSINLLVPARSLGARIRVISTLRSGGVSRGPYGSSPGTDSGLNLGEHCGDDPTAVAINRARLRQLLPGDPRWLRQVHGSAVARMDAENGAVDRGEPVADAAVTGAPLQVLAVLTADCLPVVIAGRGAEAVGIAHAGWRGLAAGVLESTLDALRVSYDLRPQDCVAWLGPAIGPRQFEVGGEVREAFCANDPRAAEVGFKAASEEGKWLANLEALATRRLHSLGLSEVIASGACTVSEPHRFYSYRRDRVTGRMATLVWID